MKLNFPAITVLLCLVLASPAQSDEARKLYKRAQKAEKRGDDVGAFLLYSQARTVDPQNRQYVMAATAIRSRAAQTLASLGNRQMALALDPSNAYLLAHAQANRPGAETTLDSGNALSLSGIDPRALRAPPVLQPQLGVRNFKLRGTIRSIYEQIAEQFGLVVIFDSDFQGQETVKFELERVTFAEAVIAMNDVATAFLVPVNPRVFLVAPDTTQKRAELEPMATAVFPLADLLGPQQVTELGQAVQQVLEIKTFQIDTARQQVLVRDTVSRVRLAQELYEHLSRPRAEVVIDVDLISVDEDRRINAGIGLPASFPITNFSTVLWNAPPQYDASPPLLGIGGGDTIFGVAVGSAALIADKLSGVGQIRSSFSVRAADGMPANFLVGERFPIINARFSAVVIDDDIQDEIDQGTLREPFPSFTFEDLGLVFKVTPHVHSARDISLELQAEVKQLTGVSLNDLPVLTNRNIESYVRLHEGQAALITGMAVLERRSDRSGFGFLSEIPLLGNLFRRHSWQFRRSNLILMVRPRLVRLPPAEAGPALTLRYGPEARPLPPI